MDTPQFSHSPNPLIDWFTRLADRLLRQHARYSPAETAQRVEAGQWINWPLFISQPAVPLLLCVFPTRWAVVVLATLILDVLWIRRISPRFVSPRLLRVGTFVVQSKWLLCPIAAAVLWQRVHPVIAIVALTWPVIVLPLAYSLHELRRPSALEDTQRRLARARRTEAP